MNQNRHADNILQDHFQKSTRAIVLLGARQVGKTTLLKRLFPDAQYYLMDNEAQQALFERYDISYYKSAISHLGTEMLILDEVQLLSNPGRAIKILFDQIPGMNIIATGSSTLHIKNKIAESMAGRKIEYHLFPLTLSEILVQRGIEQALGYKLLNNITHNKLYPEKAHTYDLRGILLDILTYGQYPYLIENPRDTDYLENLVSDSIFRDIVELHLVENRADAVRLLKLLAYQIGNLINYSELANKLSIDVRTVRRYIEIFEQSFIIFRLYPFTSNRRGEIGKAPKIYFYDVGVRNAIVEDFSDPLLRRDFGALFENFIISEVLKSNSYKRAGYNLSYWRTKAGTEVDLVLHNAHEVIGCEVKTTKGRISRAFTNRFPKAKTRLITMDNFW